MELNANIVIKLKKNVSDPVGETLTRTIEGLGHEDIKDIRSGKYFEVRLSSETKSEEELKNELKSICETVLTHPVMEDYKVTPAPQSE